MKNHLREMGLVAVVTLGVATLVAAQGPRFGGPGGFGHHGRGEMGVRSVADEPFQATFTRTRVENVVVNGSASSITTTTTGTLARDASGDTYEDSTLPGRGSSTGHEMTFIRNVTNMQNYVVNVTKQTYQQFPMRTHNGSNNGNWSGRNGAAGTGSNNPNRPTPTQVNYTVPNSNYTCAAEEVKFSRTIQPPSAQGGAPNPSITITSDRIYCPALHQVLMETSSDPRTGTNTLQLSGLNTSPSVSFMPPPGFTQAPMRNFQRGQRATQLTPSQP